MPTNEQLQALLDDYVTGTIAGPERQQLLEWLNDPLISRQAEALIQQELESGRYESDPLPAIHARLHARLRQAIDSSAVPVAQKPSVVRRLVAGKRWWAAAAVFILLLAGAGLYRYSRQTPQPVIASVPQKDIAPGGNRALLTLADGSTITLDSAAIGKLAEQSGSTITKTADGQLEYNVAATGSGQSSIGFNTLATPRGGQFRLTLPDGTKVWLNAASSIKYPAVFSGNERQVAITGEVYFEVAHDRAKPFKVTKGELSIAVLGTNFNINAYDDEKDIRVTLLEGSVLVSAAPVSAALHLRPGQ
ncbi:MAG: FecR domain-containing protein, partial [Bacteroidetes bacterium]|nr:FecR domain-containing protein [Bacteroidota bacterium]